MKTPETFVPLTAAPTPSAPREFRVAIINGHSHNPPANAPGNPAGTGGNGPQGTPASSAADQSTFQNLAAPSAPAPSLSSVTSMDKKLGEPRVTVQRDGDRVTHLRIQCTCGQIMELACVYDTPSNS
jgi:hypothetical protein